MINNKEVASITRVSDNTILYEYTYEPIVTSITIHKNYYDFEGYTSRYVVATVYDQKNNPISDKEVTLTDVSTNRSFVHTTDENGVAYNSLNTRAMEDIWKASCDGIEVSTTGSFPY